MFSKEYNKSLRLLNSINELIFNLNDNNYFNIKVNNQKTKAIIFKCKFI